MKTERIQEVGRNLTLSEAKPAYLLFSKTHSFWQAFYLKNKIKHHLDWTSWILTQISRSVCSLLFYFYLVSNRTAYPKPPTTMALARLSRRDPSIEISLEISFILVPFCIKIRITTNPNKRENFYYDLPSQYAFVNFDFCRRHWRTCHSFHLSNSSSKLYFLVQIYFIQF